MGTGGDFRRSLGLEHQLDAYLAALTSGRERRVDVGKATFVDEGGATIDHYFINVLSAGLGGLVDRYVSQSPPFIGGGGAYYIASLRALGACRRRPLQIRMWVPDSDAGNRHALTGGGTDGDDTHGGRSAAERFSAAAPSALIERQVEAWIVAVCNGSWFGAGMHVCPPALPDDGLLDVVMVTVPTKSEFVRKLPSVYRGEHLAIAGVEHIRCTRIEMELDEADVAIHGRNAGKPYLLDVDGEPLGRLPLTVEIVPSALRLCV
jgi:diacylglycerol kinase family enzyme